MVVQQRLAVYRVVVAVVAIALYLVLIPRLGLMRAQAAFAVLGFLGLTPLIFRSRGQVTDERDRAIHLRAFQIGTAMFWLVFTAGLWSIYYHFMDDRVVPLAVISLLAWMTWTTFELCNAAAVLFLYGRS